MKIRQAMASDKLRWDSYVHTHERATPYHLFAWSDAVREAYGFSSYRIYAEESERIVGILSYVILRCPFGKIQFVALPYCDIGGVLADNSAVEILLIQAVLKEAGRFSGSVVELRGELTIEATESCELSVQSNSKKVRMILQLPGSSEELWSGFKSKLRSQIRKAERNGLTFEFTANSLNDFYSVLSSNMRDLGSPVHSRKWFDAIVRQYGDSARVGLVRNGDKAIGAGIILRSGDKVSIPWASTLRDYNRLGPNMLLYWGLLKYSADTGATEFDFGRSTMGEGTYKFKEQWGARAYLLAWYNSRFQGNFSKSPDDSSKIREIVERIWQKMPLPVVNAIGPKVRKYISL